MSYLTLNLTKGEYKMAEPIEIKGHSKGITIKLPSSYRITGAAGSTIIEIDSDPEAPFTSLAVRNEDEPDPDKREKFRSPEYKSRWNITIE